MKKQPNYQLKGWSQDKMRMYADSWGEGVPLDWQSGDKHKRFRTDFSQTMEPSRGARTYPTVTIING